PLWRAIYESMSGQLRSESLSDLCAGILIERSRRTGVPAEESLDRYRSMVADGLVTENDWSTDDPPRRDIGGGRHAPVRGQPHPHPLGCRPASVPARPGGADRPGAPSRPDDHLNAVAARTA